MLQAPQGLGLHSLGSGIMPSLPGQYAAAPRSAAPAIAAHPSLPAAGPGLHSPNSGMQVGLFNPQPVQPACSAIAANPQVFLLQGQACPA